MSIQALKAKGLIDINTSSASGSESDVTLAFALDSGYLECFKVMLASMAKNGVLCNCPIAVYSDDEAIFQDPVVKAVTDKPVLLSGKRKEVIYSLAKNNVKRQERADWNRGTFLKWCVFEPQDTNRLLFLDVDMLVLRPLDALLDLFPSTSLVTAPQFQQSLREGDIDANLMRMLTGGFERKHQRRINSGMMLVNSDFLSNEFFNEITTFAGERLSIHEQGHLSEFFYSRTNKLSMVPSAYNFQESYLRLLNSDTYDRVLDQIAILHYAGNTKPWKPEYKDLLSYRSMRLWHDYKLVAKEILSFR